MGTIISIGLLVIFLVFCVVCTYACIIVGADYDRASEQQFQEAQARTDHTKGD